VRRGPAGGSDAGKMTFVFIKLLWMHCLLRLFVYIVLPFNCYVLCIFQGVRE
jgi:hypothetical protein